MDHYLGDVSQLVARVSARLSRADATATIDDIARDALRIAAAAARIRDTAHRGPRVRSINSAARRYGARVVYANDPAGMCVGLQFADGAPLFLA